MTDTYSVNKLLDQAGKLIDSGTRLLQGIPSDREVEVAKAYIAAADALARMAQARVAC